MLIREKQSRVQILTEAIFVHLAIIPLWKTWMHLFHFTIVKIVEQTEPYSLGRVTRLGKGWPNSKSAESEINNIIFSYPRDTHYCRWCCYSIRGTQPSLQKISRPTKKAYYKCRWVKRSYLCEIASHTSIYKYILRLQQWFSSKFEKQTRKASWKNRYRNSRALIGKNSTTSAAKETTTYK